MAGAVYVMGTPELLEVAERVTHVAPLQPEPLNDHRTLLLRRVVVTVAVNCCLPPGVATVAVVGEMVTLVCAATVETKIRTQQANKTNAASNRTTERRGGVAGMSGQPPAIPNKQKSTQLLRVESQRLAGRAGRILALQIKLGE